MYLPDVATELRHFPFSLRIMNNGSLQHKMSKILLACETFNIGNGSPCI